MNQEAIDMAVAALSRDRWAGWAWSPDAVRAVADLISPGSEHEQLAKFFVQVRRAAALDAAQFGALIGATTLDRGLAEADQLVWHDLAEIELAWVCDFYEVVHVEHLLPFCGAFLMQRVRGLSDPEVAVYQGASLSQVFCIRLSGYPLTYGYLEQADWLRFAGAMVRFCVEGLRSHCTPAVFEREYGRLARGMARLVGKNSFGDATVDVPGALPPNPQGQVDSVRWQEGDDHVFLYAD